MVRESQQTNVASAKRLTQVELSGCVPLQVAVAIGIVPENFEMRGGLFTWAWMLRERVGKSNELTNSKKTQHLVQLRRFWLFPCGHIGSHIV